MCPEAPASQSKPRSSLSGYIGMAHTPFRAPQSLPLKSPWITSRFQVIPRWCACQQPKPKQKRISYFWFRHRNSHPRRKFASDMAIRILPLCHTFATRLPQKNPQEIERENNYLLIICCLLWITPVQKVIHRPCG